MQMTNKGRIVVAAAAAVLAIQGAAGALMTGPRGGTSGTNCVCGPTTTRVSANTAGGEPNQMADWGSISSDGRFASFVSDADNLAAGDNNGKSDVFLRDRTNAITERISVSNSGAEANGASYTPEIASSGRFVAFGSLATNLTSDTGGGQFQLYLRDLVARTTIRVSKSSSGASADTGFTSNGVVSADGRFVAFTSGATNLVVGDTNNSPDIFLRDVLNGTTIRVSVTSTGAPMGPGKVGFPSISDNGRLVAFESDAPLHPADANGKTDVYLWDANSGTTTPVSIDATERFGLGQSLFPDISGDGTTVAFNTDSALDPSDTNAKHDVYMRTLATGSIARASLGAGNVQGNADSSRPSLSTNGDVVSFLSSATNLVSDDTNNRSDVFIRRVSSSATFRATLSTGGVQSDGHVFDNDLAGNGSVVIFQSVAKNLVSPDMIRPIVPDEILARTF
jgi:hypothetical protein